MKKSVFLAFTEDSDDDAKTISHSRGHADKVAKNDKQKQKQKSKKQYVICACAKIVALIFTWNREEQALKGLAMTISKKSKRLKNKGRSVNHNSEAAEIPSAQKTPPVVEPVETEWRQAMENVVISETVHVVDTSSNSEVSAVKGKIRK
jgi:hypothetical protein